LAKKAGNHSHEEEAVESLQAAKLHLKLTWEKELVELGEYQKA